MSKCFNYWRPAIGENGIVHRIEENASRRRGDQSGPLPAGDPSRERLRRITLGYFGYFIDNWDGRSDLAWYSVIRSLLVLAPSQVQGVL